jgi:hypothetical protein
VATVADQGSAWNQKQNKSLDPALLPRATVMGVNDHIRASGEPTEIGIFGRDKGLPLSQQPTAAME